MERERRQQLEVLDQEVGVVVERLDDRVEVLEVRGEIVLGLLQDVATRRSRSVRSAPNASTMLARLSLSTFSASGSVSSVRPRLSLLRARIPAKRFEPFGGRDDVVGLPIQRTGQLGQPGHQVGEAALAARDRVVGLVGDVLQRTEIALVHHHAERRQHLLGGRIAPGALQRDLRAVGQLARLRARRPAPPIRCAANPAARSARPSQSRSRAGLTFLSSDSWTAA